MKNPEKQTTISNWKNTVPPFRCSEIEENPKFEKWKMFNNYCYEKLA